MKRNFVEPQMKVMAVNMKENIAASCDELVNIITGKNGQTKKVYVHKSTNKIISLEIFDASKNYKDLWSTLTGCQKEHATKVTP